MDHLQRSEIHFIQSLQDAFPNHEAAMVTITRLGDPRRAFLLWFPIAFCLFGARSGLQVLWVAVVSEWLNAVLKWLMMGQRPYWWVMESPVYIGEERPFLKQFASTCETGPGCPSGHVMVTSAVWFVFVASLNEAITADTPPQYPDRVRILRRITWAVYGVFVALVAVTRVYTATHFPHQVILGAVTGVLLGAKIRQHPVEDYGFGSYFLGGLFVFFTIFLEYHLLSLIGLDPGWSLKLALKQCVYREWVHLDTTLFYAVARDVGAFVFAGMMCSCVSVSFDRTRGQYGAKVAATLLTLAAAQVIESIYVPRWYIALFYVLGAFKYGMVSVTTVALNQIVASYGSSSPSS